MPTTSPSLHVSRTPLKDQNRISILAVLGLNLAALIIAVKTDNLLSSGVDELVKQWRDFLPAGVGVVFAGVVNGLLSSDAKARLVFWRWSNRHFLLTRDYAGIAFLLLLTAGPLGIWQIPSMTTAAIYMGLLLMQYLGARHAAQNYGVRFVTKYKSARKHENKPGFAALFS